VIPIERKPRRNATRDAAGIQLRNASIPRIRSNASYAVATVPGNGTPSKKRSVPNGDSSFSAVSRCPACSRICSADKPAYVDAISKPSFDRSTPALSAAADHRGAASFPAG
jgi:hypothetical protein